MPPLNEVLGRAVIGAVLGTIIAAIVVIALYTVFFQGGYRFMDAQMIPIYIVIGSIGAVLGAMAGAGTVLTRKENPTEPPSRR
jgi:hypothetical protein